MGSTMIVALLALIGLTNAQQMTQSMELRSDMEFLENFSSNLDSVSSYRLTNSVQPSWVYVDLDVYLSESRTEGIVRHEVNISETLEEIVMHQNVAAVTGVNLLDSNNNVVLLNLETPFELDYAYELLIIKPVSPVTAGAYTIVVSFHSNIHENQFDRAFYKGYYFINGTKREYATTQFQPFYARRTFPCFDEPQFKARYVISITRDANLSPSYSNMAINNTETVAGGRIRETFLPTPTISVYLVAFLVSDFVETTDASTEGKPFGIVSRPGVVVDHHEYAHDIGMKITDEMSEYFNFDYYTMGEGVEMKNDHIAIPDFVAGAMENWGMVNYREAYLLYDPDNTNINNKIFIATIMAHELAHKWFGNLVTCFWWSNLWLNESYASFFEYFSAHAADPSFELDDQFIVDYVHSALNWDAFLSATPMNLTTVEDNPSISGHFSTTSYAKGASVLRMMEHFVGATTFRTALRTYLADNAYQLGTPSDMYDAFRSATAADSTYAATYGDVDVGAVFDSWVQNPGSPVLNVDVNMNTGVITISQRRFILSGTIPNTQWLVPYTWTHGGAPDFTSTKPSRVLTTASTTETMPAGHNWVVFNIQQSGLYRVNYDDHNWEMLAAALRSNKDQFPRQNRAQFVNDVLHFLRAGESYITIARAFDVISFLEEEDDYLAWAGALGQLDLIRRRIEHIPAAYNEFSAYLLEMMEFAVESLGYEELTTDSTTRILNRMQIMNYACNLGHEGCITDSLVKWNAFKANTSNLVPVNARRYVYCAGLRHGDATDYDFLFNQYETSENTADMVVILRALGCTTDQNRLAHFLQQTLYNDKIRYHDRTNAFSFALQGNKENLQTVLTFVQNDLANIREHYGGVARLNVALNALTTYLTDFEDISNFQVWAYENQVALETSFANAKNVVDSAIANLQWGNSVVTDIYSFLRSRNAAGGITAPTFMALLLAAVMAHFIR